VIELWGVVDRPEKAGQIIEEGIIASADVRFDLVAIGRFYGERLINIDDGYEAPTRELNKLNRRLAGLIYGDSHLGGAECAEVLLPHRIKVPQQRFEAWIARRGHHPGRRVNLDPVEQVGVQDAGMRDGSERQSDDNLLASAGIVAWETEEVVEVGGLTSMSEKIEFTAFGSL
jgi:hypothetical protein